MPTVNLDTAELLQFLHDWLAIDLSRFTFLLGGSDGEGLFAQETT